MENEKTHNRPSWDEYFMQIVDMVGSRGTCDRGRSGCVITKNKRIVSTGYVGSPIGISHCDEVGHLLKKITHEDSKVSTHCVRTVHAEQNAICQAARLGIALEGSTLYCRMTPCRTCTMLIINCGIERVVCEKKYHTAGESEEMFEEAGLPAPSVVRCARITAVDACAAERIGVLGLPQLRLVSNMMQRAFGSSTG